MKNFTESKRLPATDKPTMKDLSHMTKKMPEYQKELSNYATHFHLVDDCMKRFNGNVDKLFKLEQVLFTTQYGLRWLLKYSWLNFKELVTGTDVEGEKIKDHMVNMLPILLDPKVTKCDKIRILLLFILSKNGISEENLTSLMKHAHIPTNERIIMTNMALLRYNVIVDVTRIILLLYFLLVNRIKRFFFN